MVENLFFLIIGLSSILLSIFATYLSYELYKYNRLSVGWLALTLAVLLTVFVRVVVFFEDSALFSELNPLVLKTWNVLLLFSVNILFVVGFWSLKKSFESFEVIQKKTALKIRGMSSRRGD